MAKATSGTKIDFEVTLVLNEAEARMLVEMTGYGADPFLRGYYKLLGKSYMKPHENALRTFFSSINTVLPSELKKIDEIKKTFDV